jgi:hypothetical protein
MRKTKILIKSFEELSKCFPQEEIEFTYHQIASVFSEEEVSYWIGSGIEMEAYMYQDDWNYCMHGKVYRWKDFEELSLKDRYKLAKEYYGSKFRPYITYFLQQKFGKKNED